MTALDVARRALGRVHQGGPRATLAFDGKLARSRRAYTVPDLLARWGHR